jgi:hypothetical protein
MYSLGIPSPKEKLNITRSVAEKRKGAKNLSFDESSHLA